MTGLRKLTLPAALLGGLTLLTSGAPRASAQPTAPPPVAPSPVGEGAAATPSANTEEQARKHYQEGVSAYNGGEFDRAVKEYKAAYALKRDPALLFNIAQAYRLAKDFEQALFFYRSYLRSQPQAANRAEVEDRIVKLEEELAKQKERGGAASPAAAPAPSTEPPPAGGAPALGSPPAVQPGASAPAAAPLPISASAVDLSAPAPADVPSSQPIFKKWWFWAGAGAVVVGAIVIGVAASGSGGSTKPPASQLGNTRIF